MSAPGGSDSPSQSFDKFLARPLLGRLCVFCFARCSMSARRWCVCCQLAFSLDIPAVIFFTLHHHLCTRYSAPSQYTVPPTRSMPAHPRPECIYKCDCEKYCQVYLNKCELPPGLRQVCGGTWYAHAPYRAKGSAAYIAKITTAAPQGVKYQPRKRRKAPTTPPPKRRKQNSSNDAVSVPVPKLAL